MLLENLITLVRFIVIFLGVMTMYYQIYTRIRGKECKLPSTKLHIIQSSAVFFMLDSFGFKYLKFIALALVICFIFFYIAEQKLGVDYRDYL